MDNFSLCKPFKSIFDKPAQDQYGVYRRIVDPILNLEQISELELENCEQVVSSIGDDHERIYDFAQLAVAVLEEKRERMRQLKEEFGSRGYGFLGEYSEDEVEDQAWKLLKEFQHLQRIFKYVDHDLIEVVLSLIVSTLAGDRKREQMWTSRYLRNEKTAGYDMTRPSTEDDRLRMKFRLKEPSEHPDGIRFTFEKCGGRILKVLARLNEICEEHGLKPVEFRPWTDDRIAHHTPEKLLVAFNLCKNIHKFVNSIRHLGTDVMGKAIELISAVLRNSSSEIDQCIDLLSASDYVDAIGYRVPTYDLNSWTVTMEVAEFDEDGPTGIWDYREFYFEYVRNVADVLTMTNIWSYYINSDMKEEYFHGNHAAMRAMIEYRKYFTDYPYIEWDGNTPQVAQSTVHMREN